MTSILNVLFKITLAAMPVAIGLCLYVSWVERTYPPEQVWQDTWSGCYADKCYFCWNVGEDNQECIEYGTIGIGPVEPQPRIEDHTTAVMRQDCPACPDCPTWDALRRAGVEITCTNAFGEVPSVNYWPSEMPMACSRIKKVVIHDKRIEVERR